MSAWHSITAASFLLCCDVHAMVTPSSLFTSSMVLQESSTRPAVINGNADPGEVVTLEDNSQHHSVHRYSTTAGSGGHWSIELAPYVLRDTDPNNFTLTLSGSGGCAPIVANNVAYGDVLLCSGQSNMALMLGPSIYDQATILANANRPEIRLFGVSATFAATPQGFFDNAPQWTPSNAHSVSRFSAICYLTALELQRIRAPRPSGAAGTRAYGLIKSAVGSTDVQSWMSSQARDAAAKCWQPTSSALPPSNSHSPKNGTNASWLWNAMIAPIARCPTLHAGRCASGKAPFSIRAVLWDQGENNANYCTREQYNCFFSSLIADWREAFSNPELPVAFVQIGGYHKGVDPSTTPPDSNAVTELRFAQGDTLPEPQLFSNITGLSVEGTAMALTFDLGSAQQGDPRWHIHCKNKTEVARRLGLQLLRLLEPSTDAGSWSGGVVQKIERMHDAQGRPYAEISMRYAAGLTLAPAEGCVECCDQSSKRVSTDPFLFEVANRKGKWLQAAGEVINGKVRVTPHTNVTGDWLSAVRYAVLDIPQCGLYNDAWLPAAPFEFPVPWGSDRIVV